MLVVKGFGCVPSDHNPAREVSGFPVEQTARCVTARGVLVRRASGCSCWKDYAVRAP